MPEATAKTPISQQDYNWNIHLAALRAEAAAKAAGGVDPNAAAALLSAGAGKVIIAGHAFPPVTAAFILLLPMLQKAALNDDVLGTEGGQVMMMAWALAHPSEAWVATKAALREGSADNLVEAVQAFATGFPLRDLLAVSEWVASELKSLQSDAEEAEVPGKPTQQATASPPTPPESTEPATTATAGC